MKSEKPAFTNVDEYIATTPAAVQIRLQQLRKTIKTAAPKAEEVISYGMPAYKYEGVLVYFGAWREHIGFYPATKAVKVFQSELEPYEVSKGTIKFPFKDPLPLKLISAIVKMRVQENLLNAEEKKRKRKKT